MLLEGVLAPLTSCFYSDGRPYWRKLEHNVERYSRGPLSGLVLLGSTGEAVMLSDEESRETLRVARDAAWPEKVLVAGVGRESVIETLRLAEYAARLDYDAVLVRTPHFYRPQMREREMLTYYQSVADRSPLPVVLYSIPSYTAYDLPVPVIAELANHPNIIGIKDSSGKVDRIREIVEATRAARKRTVTVTSVFAAVTARVLASSPAGERTANFIAAERLGQDVTAVIAVPQPAAPGLQTRTKEVGFQVLSGSAQTFLSALQVGATGGVIGPATFIPQAIHEVYTTWKENDLALAEEKQMRVFDAGAQITSRMGVPGVKHALDVNGYFGGHPRLPLLPLTAEEQHKVEELLRDLRN